MSYDDGTVKHQFEMAMPHKQFCGIWYYKKMKSCSPGLELPMRCFVAITPPRLVGFEK